MSFSHTFDTARGLVSGLKAPVMNTVLLGKKAPEAVATDSAKRRQIMDGARAVFLAQGFDASSMGEIARRAGVSKGTLYVYFDSKEKLFEAFAQEQCTLQAEQLFALIDEQEPEAALTRLGREYVHYLCRPDRLSPIRTVMGIADRMPDIGKAFFETGPGTGTARLAAYLDKQVAAGVLAIEDTEVAASQFLDACQSTLFKPMLFNIGGPPTDEKVNYVVGIAVRVFMAAYRKR